MPVQILRDRRSTAMRNLTVLHEKLGNFNVDEQSSTSVIIGYSQMVESSHVVGLPGCIVKCYPTLDSEADTSQVGARLSVGVYNTLGLIDT